MTDLGAYLSAAARTSWDWGRHDCCTLLAGWVMSRGHSDPMSFIRGRYRSEMGALRRVKEGGGLVPLWQRGMGDAGVPETDDPRMGDVGILNLPTEEGESEVCAIRSAERWVCLTKGGIVAFPAPHIIAWRP